MGSIPVNFIIKLGMTATVGNKKRVAFSKPGGSPHPSANHVHIRASNTSILSLTASFGRYGERRGFAKDVFKLRSYMEKRSYENKF